MSELKLRGYFPDGSLPKHAYPVFIPATKFVCHHCGGPLLVETIPPNYSGGGLLGNIFGGGAWESRDGGNIKHICLKCKIHFTVSWWYNVKHEPVAGSLGSSTETVDRGHSIFGEVPLIEFNDELLTPSQMQDEKYKEEHGEYPVHVYA